MDKTSNLKDIPEAIAEAYKLLHQAQVVNITEPIQQNPKQGAADWVFKCIAQVPFPNENNLPCEVHLCVSIPETFPRKPVDIYPISEEIRGFPHQDAAGLRKLCLREERLAPLDTSRLICYVEWAIEWLKDAANGTLLNLGESHELPDFRNKSTDSSLPTKSPLIIEESSKSYECWKYRNGEFGHVECFWGPDFRTIFAVRFFDNNGSLIRDSEFASTVLKKDGKIEGKWVLIPDIRYERHCPPQTYEEIVELCSKNDVNFYQNLKAAWSLNNACKFGILLVGFPIPKIIGQDPTEIHWQPILFQNYGESKKQPMKRGKHRQPSRKERSWQKLIENGDFSSLKQLLWGYVENVARERLYIRGCHPLDVQSASIAFFGCGALGSSVAELLARGGVKQLNLFDPDLLKFGNLCRHTLDGSSVGFNKAKELANRLSRANPVSSIKGYAVGIPLNSSSGETVHQVLADAEVFVDCTTSEAAFDWLNEYAVEKGKRLISTFFNIRAELLTICISGESTSCKYIFEDLNNSIKNNETDIDPDVYSYEPSPEEEIMEGAGCWHPTFPALNTHIQILAAHAVDIISHSINSKSKKGLAAIIERQSVLYNGVQPGPLVKIAWTKEY